jgi:type IV pilus assembly protein PilA
MNRNEIRLPRGARGNALYAPVVFIGILAGIAVPAYSDYTIRSHVAEGLNLASSVKASVAEFYAEHQKWPRDLRELKFEQVPRSANVVFAAANRGTVVIRYSQRAGTPVGGRQLTLRPTVGAQGDVMWSCGYTPDPGGDPPTGPASPHATNIEPKYLPSSCRG